MPLAKRRLLTGKQSRDSNGEPCGRICRIIRKTNCFQTDSCIAFFPDYISNVQPTNFFGKKKFDYHFLNYLWDVANSPQKQRELDHLVSFTFELWSLVRKKDR